MKQHQDKRYFDSKRIIWSVIVFIIFAIILGMIAFHFAEWRDYFHSLYFTVVTFSTIWYGDVIPVTYLWKSIAMVYALLWVPLFVWITSVVMEIRFKKFIFHHFEHHTKWYIKKTEAELKKELTQEELRTAEQELEIKKIEKTLKEVKKEKIKSFFSNIFKKLKKQK